MSWKLEVGLVDADRLVEPDAARHRQAQRQPGEGHAGEDEQGRRCGSCPARRARGSLPRGPKSSASRAPRRRRQSVRDEFASSGFGLHGPAPLGRDCVRDSTRPGWPLKGVRG